MKFMRVLTHEKDSNIPVGKAALTIDDKGWVGTNIGCPFHGQPALFPIEQATAIAYTWNDFALASSRSPVTVSPDVQEWLS